MQTGGDGLLADVKEAIEQARAVLVVLSPNTVNSSWVRTEVQLARRVKRRRGKSDYKVIPILLPGIEQTAPGLWFDKEPLAIKITVGPGGIEQALPSLFAVLGEQLPDDLQPAEVSGPPVADLILELPRTSRSRRCSLVSRRAVAKARLVFDPPQSGAPLDQEPPVPVRLPRWAELYPHLIIDRSTHSN